MANDVTVYDSIEGSNLRPSVKSRVIQLLEASMPSDSAKQTVLGMLVETTVAGSVGATLGVLHAELKDGLDYNGKYPLDLGLGIVSKVGGKVYGSSISREVGNVAIGVYTFRNVSTLLELLKNSSKKRPQQEEPVAAE